MDAIIEKELRNDISKLLGEKFNIYGSARKKLSDDCYLIVGVNTENIDKVRILGKIDSTSVMTATDIINLVNSKGIACWIDRDIARKLPESILNQNALYMENIPFITAIMDDLSYFPSGSTSCKGYRKISDGSNTCEFYRNTDGVYYSENGGDPLWLSNTSCTTVHNPDINILLPAFITSKKINYNQYRLFRHIFDKQFLDVKEPYADASDTLPSVSALNNNNKFNKDDIIIQFTNNNLSVISINSGARYLIDKSLRLWSESITEDFELLGKLYESVNTVEPKLVDKIKQSVRASRMSMEEKFKWFRWIHKQEAQNDTKFSRVVYLINKYVEENIGKNFSQDFNAIKNNCIEINLCNDKVQLSFIDASVSDAQIHEIISIANSNGYHVQFEDTEDCIRYTTITNMKLARPTLFAKLGDTFDKKVNYLKCGDKRLYFNATDIFVCDNYGDYLDYLNNLVLYSFVDIGIPDFTKNAPATLYKLYDKIINNMPIDDNIDTTPIKLSSREAKIPNTDIGVRLHTDKILRLSVEGAGVNVDSSLNITSVYGSVEKVLRLIKIVKPAIRGINSSIEGDVSSYCLASGDISLINWYNTIVKNKKEDLLDTLLGDLFNKINKAVEKSVHKVAFKVIVSPEELKEVLDNSYIMPENPCSTIEIADAPVDSVNRTSFKVQKGTPMPADKSPLPAQSVGSIVDKVVILIKQAGARLIAVNGNAMYRLLISDIIPDIYKEIKSWYETRNIRTARERNKRIKEIKNGITDLEIGFVLAAIAATLHAAPEKYTNMIPWIDANKLVDEIETTLAAGGQRFVYANIKDLVAPYWDQFTGITEAIEEVNKQFAARSLEQTSKSADHVFQKMVEKEPVTA